MTRALVGLVVLAGVAGGCRLGESFLTRDVDMSHVIAADMETSADLAPATCAAGTHLCAGRCVSSNDPQSCNQSCTPCAPPLGGTATCDGTACGAACSSGTQLCLGVCIAAGSPCNGSCPTGTHNCAGDCASDTSPNSCGMSCTPCPAPSNATTATCSSGACGFTCASGYKQCGSSCIASSGCCSTSDCTQPSNGSASCSGNVCVVSCVSGYVPSGQSCVPWSCPSQGQACSAGVGACAGTGTTVCTAQGVGACTAVAGSPDHSGTWHLSAAANGSWDWNCDGELEYQYPSGNTTPPPNSWQDCEVRTSLAACLADNWYYDQPRQPSCGWAVDNYLCMWTSSNSSCSYALGQMTETQGCQ